VRVYRPSACFSACGEGFRDTPRRDVIGVGIELGVDFQNTWSCHEDTDIPCGECEGRFSRFTWGRWAKGGPGSVEIPSAEGPGKGGVSASDP